MLILNTKFIKQEAVSRKGKLRGPPLREQLLNTCSSRRINLI